MAWDPGSTLLTETTEGPLLTSVNSVEMVHPMKPFVKVSWNIKGTQAT